MAEGIAMGISDMLGMLTAIPFMWMAEEAHKRERVKQFMESVKNFSIEEIIPRLSELTYDQRTILRKDLARLLESTHPDMKPTAEEAEQAKKMVEHIDLLQKVVDERRAAEKAAYDARVKAEYDEKADPVRAERARRKAANWAKQHPEGK